MSMLLQLSLKYQAQIYSDLLVTSSDLKYFQVNLLLSIIATQIMKFITLPFVFYLFMTNTFKKIIITLKVSIIVIVFCNSRFWFLCKLWH